MAERRTIVIIGVMITLVVGSLFVWSLSAPNDQPSGAGLTEVSDSAAIENHVEVSRIGILTSENYVGHRIRIIEGTIKNISGKPLRLVEMKMVFTDYDKKPIQESVHKGYEVTQKPLAPGAQYRFRVNFEKLPKDWNYHIPNIEVVKIGY